MDLFMTVNNGELLRRSEKTCYRREPTTPMHVVMLISLLFKVLALHYTLYFNFVFGNTAVLYRLSASSGSCHCVTNKDLCSGHNSILL